MKLSRLLLLSAAMPYTMFAVVSASAQVAPTAVKSEPAQASATVSPQSVSNAETQAAAPDRQAGSAEIVVTADRREERSVTVPVVVSVQTTENIARYNATVISSLGTLTSSVIVGIYGPKGGSSITKLRLVGRNLKNEYFLLYASDRTGGSGVPGAIGEQRGVVNRGRQIALPGVVRVPTRSASYIPETRT